MNKESAYNNRPVDLLLLAGAFLILFFFGLRTISGSEIFLHLAAGRFAMLHGVISVDPFSFGLPPGTSWTQTTWLYDMFMVKIWSLGGASAITLLHVSATVGAFLLLVPVASRYSSTLHQAIALMISAWIFASLYSLRPMLLCLLFAAAFMNILERNKLSLRYGILLGVIQLLWVNMHTSFMLGLFFVAMRGLQAFLNRQRLSEGESAHPAYFGLFIALAMIGLINPAGPLLYGDVFKQLLRPESGVILEWASPFIREFLPSATGHLTTVLLVLIAAVFVTRKERLPVMLTGCAVLGAYLIVKSTPNLDLCAVLVFPFLCMSLASISARISSTWETRTRGTVTSVITAAFAVVWLGTSWVTITNRYYVYAGSASSFGLGINQDVLPAAAANFLGQREIRPDRILNIAHDGGYLLWRLPQDKVFTDPRGDLYGGTFYNKLSRGLLGHRDSWNELMDRFDFDAILLNATWSGAGSMAYHLLKGDQWAMVYFDGTSLLLARRTSSNSALLDNQDMQKFGLNLIETSYQRYRERLSSRVMRPPNPGRLIGAAAVFQALGRHQEALPILEALNIGSPRMSSAWVNRGIAESVNGRHEQAIKTLEYAGRILPKHPLIWLWLGHNYKMVGRDTDAARAFEIARTINPRYAEQFEKDVSRTGMKFDSKPEM
ncbi:MAG TPA: tetratricopeptide repeat protein [Kiritimatiellia bacterium]|nr:tetratricopeptide repeat protein [Kiritimatiellia bacterium]